MSINKNWSAINKNLNFLSKLTISKQKKINDIYNMTIMFQSLINKIDIDDINFVSPRKNQIDHYKTLNRISKSLDESIEEYQLELYRYMIINLIVIVDEFINQVIKVMIDENIINSNSYIINSPLKQKIKKVNGYLNSVIDKHCLDCFFEIKETRDLIIHGENIINLKYINCCGKYSRGNIGEEIKIDLFYFEESIIVIKHIIGKINSEVRNIIKSKIR